MNVGSLFSGIGGIDLGLERAGHTIVFQCEADEWRRSVLAERFPGTPCYPDVAVVESSPDTQQSGRVHSGLHALDGVRGGVERCTASTSVDLLCGGFPCQDLSVAGQRKGLMHQGGRSNLFFEFARIADELVPSGGYVLIENVPGLLSSNNGRDFAVLLATLAELGFHDLAWRILDSRHFGVPQRRRRVFIVGRRARGDSCAKVLLEPESGGGHFAESGETRSGVAGSPDEGTDGRGGTASPLMAMGGKNERGYRIGVEEASNRFIVPDISPSLQASQAIGDPSDQVAYVVADTLTSGSHPGSNMPGRRRKDDTNLVPIGLNTNRGGNADVCMEVDGSPPITGSHGNPGGVLLGSAVRRLTPRECERLQGFPDDWTALGPDSRRYAALGDAVTVPVAEWIGRRLLS